MGAPPARAPGSPVLDNVRHALAELRRTSEAVGLLPPEPPTFRGRMGARLVGLIRRALFWYTPRIVQFHRAVVRAHDEQQKAVESAIEALSQVEARCQKETQALAALRGEQAHDFEIRLKAVEENFACLAALPERDREDAARRTADQARRIDDFYVRLEEEFRGSRQTIKERISVYLPVVERALAGKIPAIVDIGCGRGEWLELLREHDWNGLGIDRNGRMVRLCESSGLKVLEADALVYMKSLPGDSLHVVTAFHVIEHLPFAMLLELLSEVYRVLAPGGVAIFETPNPRNLSMGARYFYLDPTHRHPIPSELGRLLAETQGFEHVEILELNPWPENHHLKPGMDPDLAGRFNDMFYGPQDYGIVAWKTGDTGDGLSNGPTCAS
jgi:O-antigen chain-terminating methyltransferase